MPPTGFQRRNRPKRRVVYSGPTRATKAPPRPVYHAPVYRGPTRATKAPPRPVYRPTQTQIRSSLAQERAYGSQGRQIALQARRQKRAVAHRQRVQSRAQERTYRSLSRAIQKVATQQERHRLAAPGRYYASFTPKGKVLGAHLGLKGVDANRYMSPSEAAGKIVPAPGPGTRAGLYQSDRRSIAQIISKSGLHAAQETQAERQAKRSAPILKAVEQLQRPEYAAGGVIHGLKEGSVSKALSGAAKGITLKEKRTPGQEIVGNRKGWLAGAARFGLDVALDPTTYTGIGLESAAAKAATKAAEHAASRAARASLKAARHDIETEIRKGTLKRGSKELRQRVRHARRDARSHGRVQGRRVYEAHMSKAAEKAPGSTKRGLTFTVVGQKTARRAGRAAVRKVAPKTAKRLAKRRPLAPLVRSSRAAAEAQRAGYRTIGNTRLMQRLTKATGPEQGEAIRGVLANVHGNVRPLRLSREEHLGTMGIKREGRSARGILERRAVESGDALFRKLNAEQKRQVIDALESGKSRHLPKELRDVVGRFRGEQRYQRKIERRASTLTGEVGEKSKSRGEVALGARTRQITEKDISRARENVKRATDNVRHLEQQYWRRHEDPEFTHKSWVPERKKLREQIDEARAAREKARKDFKQIFTVAEERAANKAELKRMRSERLKGQAKGYYPRIAREDIEANRSLVQRLRQGPEPERKMVTASRPRPAPSRTREYREPIATMREGTKEQQLRAERISEDLRSVMVERGRRGAKGVQAASVNRAVANEFGRKVPKEFDADVFHELHQRGEHVYRLEGPDLVRLDKTDNIEEIKRAAMSPEERAAADRKIYQQRKYAEAENLTPPPKPDTQAARYVVLRDDVVNAARARESTIGAGQPALEAFDAAQRGFKTLALSTPSYLVRNFAGDMFNAWTEQQATKLIWNLGRGQRVLQAAGKEERALGRGSAAKSQKAMRELGRFRQGANKFRRMLEPGLRDIRLKPEQAKELAPAIADNLYQVIRRGNPNLTKEQIRKQVEDRLSAGKVPAIALAHMAERMGVIRQGRFTELLDEGGVPITKLGGKGWSNVVKRVEDSHRVATFLGALQRGMSPREAAQVATDVHFDYGALTPFEKGVMRRAMPFYTFPSRNIPLQARQLMRHPGKYLTVEKAREEFANQADLKPGWEANLNPFEALQMPVPIVVGKNPDGSKKIVTVSLGQPFTDLNDVVKTAEGVTALPRALAGMDTQGDLLQLSTPLRRSLEQLGPWKTPIEVLANKSLFFHEDIAPERRTLTKAPQWAVALSKVPELGPLVAHNTRLHKVRGGEGYMWDKRAAYMMRSFGPGIVGAVGQLAGAIPGVPELGVKGTNERGRTVTQRRLGVFGPRVVPYDPKGAQTTGRYNRLNRLDARLNEIRQTYKESGQDYHGKPDYERAMKRWRVANERVGEIAPPKPGEKPKKKKPSSQRVSTGGGGSEIGLLP